MMCELSEKENFNREVKLAQVMLDNNVVALRGLGFKKYKLDARQLFLSPIADSLFSGKRQNRGQTGDKQGTNRGQTCIKKLTMVGFSTFLRAIA